MADKFARMLLPAAVLILLSVSTSAEEVRRCYWCGPLAEQVHRSQRAPPCGPDLQETLCDPGYTDCAIVATSPLYVESRLCVKFYQDECYSLYCNSSKTWRMICPCQGDLCNGQKTDRETKAFAALAKIVGKHKRSKRGLVGSKGFISAGKKNVNNNTNKVPDNETHSAMQFQESSEEQNENIETQTVITEVTNVHEENASENDMGNNIDEIKVEQDIDSEMQRDQPIDVEIKAAEDDINEETANVENNERTDTIEYIKIINVESTTTVLENKDHIPTVRTPTEFDKEQETTEIPTLTSMIPTSIEIELSIIQFKNLNDDLPPPESLLQNATPGKVTAPTTLGTVDIGTTNHIETTTHSTKEATKNNNQIKETNKTNEKDDANKEDEKNGEDQTLKTLLFIYIINLLLLTAF